MQEVKPGDKIIIHGRWRTYVAEVERVTPTGRIVADGFTFRPDGKQIGGDKWLPLYATDGTPDTVEKIKRRDFVGSVLKKMRNAQQITYEQAIAINDILDGGVG